MSECFYLVLATEDSRMTVREIVHARNVIKTSGGTRKVTRTMIDSRTTVEKVV